MGGHYLKYVLNRVGTKSKSEFLILNSYLKITDLIYAILGILHTSKIGEKWQGGEAE